MDWTPVESTVLRAAAYSPDNRTLDLKFLSGEIYRYFEVPPELYKELLVAESKGQYFNLHIRDRFRFEKFPKATGATGAE